MTYFATLAQFILILIAQQALSRPVDETVAQSGNDVSPNRAARGVGYENGKIISAQTIDAVSKPGAQTDPTIDQEDPVATTPSQPIPPSSSQSGGFYPPPSYPGSSQFGASSYGPIPGGSMMFPDFMAGVMQPPEAPYPPIMIGSPFGGFGSPLGSGANVITGPAMFLQDDDIADDPALPFMLDEYEYELETSPSEMYN